MWRIGMGRTGIVSAALCLYGAAQAETAVNCADVFETFRAVNAFDLSQCQPTQAIYTLKDCPKPAGFVADVPVTHIVLALDASGSMAGRSGSNTKMEIAKQEALAFLSDLHSTAKVSLVVYGHRGNNTEAGKSTSCATTETIHSFRASKRSLADSIGALGPVGWTPLAGALRHIQSEIVQLSPETRGETTAPVVYMISDGEETCGGDPVAAARALAQSGIRTTINTIGFDADAQTRAQLQAIAEVGGGTFYPADNASALRKQLQAIANVRGKIHRYNMCVRSNASKISGAYQRVTKELMRCYGKNDPNKFVNRALRAGKSAPEGSNLSICQREVFDAARALAAPHSKWITQTVSPSINAAVSESDAYLNKMGLLDAPE